MPPNHGIEREEPGARTDGQAEDGGEREDTAEGERQAAGADPETLGGALLFACVHTAFIVTSMIVLAVWLSFGEDECPQPPSLTL